MNNKTYIGYAGTVTIKFPHGKIKTYNNGTASLFSLIHRFLCREYISNASMPGYIMLYTAESSQLLTNTDTSRFDSSRILNTFVPINGSVMTTANEENVVFTAEISNVYLKNGINSDTLEKISLALLSADCRTTLAVVTIEDGQSLVGLLQRDMHALINWKMSFSNKIDLNKG